MSSRKRAALACTHCHRHKVRCDAYNLGSPCTRCQEDDVTCVLRERLVRPKFPGYQVLKNIEPSPRIPYQRNRQHGTQDAFMHCSQCPFLIVGDMSALDPIDSEFLTAKGCMQVPTYDILEDFLKQFFLHIQPYTPLLDEPIFWSIYERKLSAGQPRHIHLMLFHAMLFASSPYVATGTMETCGFKDKRDAWKTLYQKAKLLYNSPIKVDPITRAQTALLLSLCTSSEEPQNGSLWLSHAIQAAKQASPYTQGRTSTLSSEVERSLYNRLWCSLLLRDRILCLGLRRRPQVLSFEMNMMNSIPEETDFETEINGSRVYNPVDRRILFVAFRELCQFAIMLADALSLVYGHDCLSLPILTVQDFHSRLELTNSTQTLLELWKTSSEILSVDYEQTCGPVLRFQHLATLYYQAARINIAHYQTLLIKKHEGYLDIEVSPYISRAGEILLDAMESTVLAMASFSANNKAQSPPLSLLGMLAMPLVLSAIDFKLASTAISIQDRRRTLGHIGDILSQLRRVYSVAESISTELDKVLQLAYYTSSKVFRKGLLQEQRMPTGQEGLPAPTEPTRVPLQTLSRNWHDAFLQHTGVYLWISTTVDYYLSVGQMPQLDLPADYCFFTSPSDMTMTHSSHSLLLEHSNHGSDRKSESQASQSPLSPSMIAQDQGGEATTASDLVSGSIHAIVAPEPEVAANQGEQKAAQLCGPGSDLDFLSFEI